MSTAKTPAQERAERAANELAEFQRLEKYADRYAYYHSHPNIQRIYCKSNFSAPPDKPKPVSPPPAPAAPVIPAAPKPAAATPVPRPADKLTQPAV